MATFDPDKRVLGKRHRAYEELKDLIIKLEYRPGEMLYEPELMSRLDLGRTPIREAMQLLAAEKLVVARPHQTAFVSPILAHDLAEIVEMRLMFEVPAARMAAERGTAEDKKRLVDVCEQFRERVRADDLQGIVSGDARIHSLIAKMGRNSLLVEVSDKLITLCQRIWWLSVDYGRREERFISAHDDLERSILAGDVKAAARAAKDHLTTFQARLGYLIKAGMAGGTRT